jgi:TIR domain/Pentapeptide repeats (8 copies)
MANLKHLEILKRSVEEWNQWWQGNLDVRPDLSGVDLSDANLRGANLSVVDLRGANLSGAYLSAADLRGADLSVADLSVADLSVADLSVADLGRADLSRADLSRANLSRANLSGADLSGADLSGANLIGANLIGANLRGADLSGADLSGAFVGVTTFGSNDLSSVKGLDDVQHHGPSTIGIDTIYNSGGKIPDVFLSGCGVDENFIGFIPSLLGAVEPFQLYSCFISYSTKDEEFANRLHSRLRDAKARVWFAPEDIKGGEKIYEQIERAIQLHDRLLLVLSENSLRSNWVETEIRKAIETEKRENRRKLFPIRITNYETLKMWRCLDVDSGRDLAVEVREYFIPDFSNWKNHDSFEAAFDKLLRDLRAEEESPKSKM